MTCPEDSAGIRGLIAAVEARDGYTGSHSRVVAELAGEMARRLDLSWEEVSRIRAAALVHDVGKVGIPDSVLLKPGPLTPEERILLASHPALGQKIVMSVPELSNLEGMVLHHHERFDGSGYPHKLSEGLIPLGARIIAVADAYHAMRSDRTYQAGRCHAEVMDEIRDRSGSQFDPHVVHALCVVFATARRIDEIAWGCSV